MQQLLYLIFNEEGGGGDFDKITTADASVITNIISFVFLSSLVETTTIYDDEANRRRRISFICR